MRRRSSRVGVAVAALLLAVCGIPESTSADQTDPVAERFSAFDANSDGKITANEFRSGEAFAVLDRDSDGVITLAEARRVVASGALEGVQLPEPLPPTAARSEEVIDDDANTAAGDASEIRKGPEPIRGGEYGVGRRIADLQFVDLDGNPIRLSEFADKKAVVIAMTGIGCPLCQKYAPTLAAIEDDYAAKDVAFVFINPNESESTPNLKQAIATHGFDGAYVRGQDRELAFELEVQTTTEVFVLDAARTLIYRGAVDDQYGFGYTLEAPGKQFLRDALDAVLRGDRPQIEATWSPGCEMFYGDIQPPDRQTPVTYHNRISRIIQDNCQQCHRSGGLAPFALENYADVKDYAGMIASVVRRQVMPPWFAAPHDERNSSLDIHWANDRSLAENERRDLFDWVKAGAPEGNPADAPLPRDFPEQWAIGQPDVIYEIPKPFTVKATGQMPYQHTVVKTQFDEDRWVQAVEIQPTERAVVHHVLVFVHRAEDGKPNIDETSGFFAAYVPGNSWQRYPAGMAKKLPAGASLIFQLHYTPNGTETTDQTRLGIVFADAPPQHVIRNVGIANHRINIPPGANNHPETKRFDVPNDVNVLALMPHMHLRGKAFRYDVVLPDGRKERVLDVPRYDFNWQLEYRLADPLPIPRGSQFEITGWFDNSSNNPANPDPTRPVKWGPQTDDEMLLGYIEYYLTSEPPADEASHDRKQPPAVNGQSRDRTELTAAFQRADRNQDGKVTRQELPRKRMFDRLDLDGNDTLTLDEVLKAAASR
jgi:Ca2+-binding EF-hand superfamily protein/thiol-disulfide isomerase/thioredoxin